MTYAAKGAKIFLLRDCSIPECCTPPLPKRSDGRLKTFPSLIDHRAWSSDKRKRYRYLYNLVSGSQTCLRGSTCFKYVPLEDLVNIIMSEKDNYIKCLEEKLSGGDVDELKAQIAAMCEELSECKTTRDTLRKAMSKLENIDEIMNENNCLKARLRCSEEMVKYLEEKKCKLERELENLRSKSQIQCDLQNAQENLCKMMQKEQLAEGEELCELARERDALQRRVCELQDELLEAKTKQSELELLKKQSESRDMSLEEITKENECYKKKLATMKCLEKQIEALKKQASCLADKYKRELETLRCERDKLKRRVDELARFESQYNDLQCKLRQVESIIAENEMLNSKLAQLDKLEIENQLLRCKLEHCQMSEMEAAEGKEKILELQSAVADQEEEMKDLLCQIERLTRAYGENDELERLREELCKKDCKLKLCEEQLAEIPHLEAEIDDLRNKLEDCYNKAGGLKKPCPHRKIPICEEILGRSAGAEEHSVMGTRMEEDVTFRKQSAAVCEEVTHEDVLVFEKVDRPSEKGSMTCEEVQNLLQSSKGIISCVLEDMVEHQKEMEELEKCNREMKDEICLLKAKMGKTDMDDCFQQIAELKRVIQEKDKKICCLQKRLENDGDLGKVNGHISNLENEIEYLKELNKKMRADLEEACRGIQRCAELEAMLEEEKRARAAAEESSKQKSLSRDKSEDLSKLKKDELNLEAKESRMLNELDDLRQRVKELMNLVDELQKENCQLKELQEPCPDFLKELEEKNALEDLLNRLQCELDACRQSRAAEDCEAVKAELKRVKEQNCQLKNLVNCYKERLDLERCSRDAGSHRSSKSKGSGTSNLQDENNKLQKEITRLRCEIAGLCKTIQELECKICERDKEVEDLKACCEQLLEKTGELEKEVDEKDNQSQKLKGEVSKLLNETSKLSLDNDALKNRLKESETPKEIAGKMDIDKDLAEKSQLDSAMQGIENEVDGLNKKLEERNRAEKEKEELVKNMKVMENELAKLREQLEKCTKEKEALASGRQVESDASKAPVPPPAPTPSPTPSPAPKPVPPPEPLPPTPPPPKSSEADSKQAVQKQEVPAKAAEGTAGRPSPQEEKLLEEMRGMREQQAKSQSELNDCRGENKKLKEEIDRLTQLLKDCEKEKNREAEASKALNAKLEAIKKEGFPGAKEAVVTPGKDAQRGIAAATGEASITQPEGAAKVAFIEKATAQSGKIGEGLKPTPSEIIRLSAVSPSKIGLARGPGSPSKAELRTTPSKSIIKTSPSKLDAKRPSRVTIQAPTPSQARLLSPSKAALVSQGKATKLSPSQIAALSPSKAKLLGYDQVKITPSDFEVMTPSRLAMLSPSQLEAYQRAKAAKGATPSKATLLTPSKAAMLTPSKIAALSPSKAAMLTPSKAKLLSPSQLAAVKAQAGPSGGYPLHASASEDSSLISFSELDPDFQKFLCTLNPANHKENICEIEKRYKKKMCELQRKYDEKVKSLMNQFDKESNVRDKAYNENVSNMKTGYESDIRKLVDKHKSSIMRLQNLHEDEVKEINLNYETQMEAMQTQNENIVNDLTSGATMKFKMLAEQHNKDIKDLEKKYQQLLEQKETEHVQQIARLQNNISQNMDDVEEYHNKTMNDMTQALQGNIADIQTRHNRELKKLKKSNLKRIDIMKHKYEDLIMCERKKYERQLEDMVQRLRQGKSVADGICQCRFTGPCGPKDPNEPLDFNEVLQKILSEGLESLTFNEVALVHRKTCAATEDIILNPEVRAEVVPPIADDVCGRTQLLHENKEELLKRILALENEISNQQIETQDKIIRLEMEVKQERKRMLELRNSLQKEQEKNLERNQSVKVQHIQEVHKIRVPEIKAEIDWHCSPRRDDFKRKEHQKDRKVLLSPYSDYGRPRQRKRNLSSESERKSLPEEAKSRHKGGGRRKGKKC